LLLERSLALTRGRRFDVHLEVELVQSLWSVDVTRGAEVADAAATRAEAAGDEPGAALARTVAASAKVWAARGNAEEVEQLAREALPLLEAAGDHVGLASIWDSLALVANMRSRFADWAAAAEESLEHTRRAGRPVGPTSGLSVALALGPRPASEALTVLDEYLPETPYPADLMLRALLLAMLGRTEEAWAVARPAEERARELGHLFEVGWMADVAQVTGDLPLAAAYRAEGSEAEEKLGHTGPVATGLADLGRMFCRLGRYEEAEPLAEKARVMSDPDDVSTQVYWRQAKAHVSSVRAEHADAERLAREAVSWAGRSDSPLMMGDALSDLGEVLEAAGNRTEALAAWREALDCYERKEIVPYARSLRDRIATLQPV